MFYRRVWHFHQLGNETILNDLVGLGRNHESNSFIERVHLMIGEIRSNLANHGQDFLNVWHHFILLLQDEMLFAFLCNLDECITSHVLDTYQEVEFGQKGEKRGNKD